MVRRRVVFSGRVQGVGFRAAARESCAGRAVTGFVRNNADGTVTAEIQGDAAVVEAAEAAVRHGAPGRIERETGDEIAVVVGEVGFRITH
jgi:acylphosphatase